METGVLNQLIAANSPQNLLEHAWIPQTGPQPPPVKKASSGPCATSGESSLSRHLCHTLIHIYPRHPPPSNRHPSQSDLSDKRHTTFFTSDLPFPVRAAIQIQKKGITSGHHHYVNDVPTIAEETNQTRLKFETL